MNWKILAIGVAVVIAVFVVFVFSNPTLTAQVTGQRMEKVRAADIALVQNGPLYYAIDKGYFTEQGLEVERIRFDSPNQIIDAVIQNQADFGGTGSATGTSAIAESLNGGNLKYYVLTCVTPETGNQLIVRKNSNLSSLKDLEGKRIAKLPGVQWRTIVTRILKNNRINTEKTQLVDLAVQLQLQALENGQVDAIVALDPVATIGVERGIARTLIPGVAEKNIATPLCAGAGIISTKFMREKPETAKKVLDAMERATAEFNQDKENQVSLMVKYLAMERSIAEKLPFPSNEFIFYTQLNTTQREATQKFIDMFYEDGVMKKRVLVDDVLLK